MSVIDAPLELHLGNCAASGRRVDDMLAWANGGLPGGAGPRLSLCGCEMAWSVELADMGGMERGPMGGGEEGMGRANPGGIQWTEMPKLFALARWALGLAVAPSWYSQALRYTASSGPVGAHTTYLQAMYTADYLWILICS